MWTKIILFAGTLLGVQHLNDLRVHIVTDALSDLTRALDGLLAGSGLS